MRLISRTRINRLQTPRLQLPQELQAKPGITIKTVLLLKNPAIQEVRIVRIKRMAVPVTAPVTAPVTTKAAGKLPVIRARIAATRKATG